MIKKFSLIFIALIISGLISVAQESEGDTYRIISNGSATEIQPYINALNAANMQYHRLKYNKNIIVFDTGVKVELFSCTELISKGVTINTEEYLDSFPTTYLRPKFYLGSGNFILEEHRNISK